VRQSGDDTRASNAPAPAPQATGPDGATEESQDVLRERVTRLAFGGDPRRFDQFVNTLADATPAGVEVILRGSAVTGHKWMSDQPFDADGPGTSDLDVTFVGGGMVSLFSEFHIAGIHSVPFGDAHPFAAPLLGALRKKLCAMAGRPVNIQATTSFVQYLRDVVMGQPYLVLLKKPDDGETEHSSRD
jgi:hypothetical protein